MTITRIPKQELDEYMRSMGPDWDSDDGSLFRRHLSRLPEFRAYSSGLITEREFDQLLFLNLLKWGAFC